MTSLIAQNFPPLRDDLRASWHPVQIEPIPASGERLTIGVAVIAEGGFLVRAAPGLDRLRCLYDRRADAVIDAASLALVALERFLDQGQTRNLTSFQAPFLSIHIGNPRPASGDNLSHIAEQALRLSSSLVGPRRSADLVSIVQPDALRASQQGPRTDRLTRLVRDIVVAERPGLKDAFHRPLKAIQSKRAPVIGFVGSRMVANFNTMRPGDVTDSISKVRNSLWALLLHRDLDQLSAIVEHKVFLHAPRADDPTVDDRQLSDVDEACAEAQFEASKKSLTVDVVHSPGEIAVQLLKAA